MPGSETADRNTGPSLTVICQIHWDSPESYIELSYLKDISSELGSIYNDI